MSTWWQDVLLYKLDVAIGERNKHEIHEFILFAKLR